jgi:hypothetical protein
MSEQESEIFHGDRPTGHGEGVKNTPAKAKPQTIVAKADPAPLPETNEVPVTEELSEHNPDHLAADALASTEPSAPAVEAEYHFEVDPESLWTMSPAMQERMSGLASFAAATNQRLDEQEKVTAKLIKALKQLA